MDLHNAVAVVTGAATGVGRALAREAARLGARVVAADINDCTETVAMIRQVGGDAIAALCDVTDQAALQQLVATTLQHYGQVNVVCANAGGASGSFTIETVSLDDMRRTFELNVFGVLGTVQAFLPALKQSAANKQPALVLITGSEHSLSAPPTSPPVISYTSAKHALVGLARCMRRDLANTGVQISLLCPGFVATETLRDRAQNSEYLAQVIANYAQVPDTVAQLAFTGAGSGAFVIPTNPVSRPYCLDAQQQVLDAIAALPTT